MDERGLDMQDKLTDLLLGSVLEEDPPQKAANTMTVVALILEASREIRDEVNEAVAEGDIDSDDALEAYRESLDIILAAGRLADQVQHGETVDIPPIGHLEENGRSSES